MMGQVQGARARLARAPAAREPLDTTADVETPEHVRFRYRVAGPARRGAAYLVDLMVRAIVLGVFAFLAAIAGALGSYELDTDGFGVGALFTLFFLIDWFYYVVSETLMGGRSIGKRAFRLRVVKESGVPLSFSDSLLRNLLRAADLLPALYTLGFLVMSQDRYFRRLGDLVAGTLVVSEEQSHVRAALTIYPPPTARELSRIPARPGLNAQELEALELFVSRFGQLSEARQEELAEIIAPEFARRLGLRFRSPARFLGLLYFRATRGVLPEETQAARSPAPEPGFEFQPPTNWHGYGP